MKKKKIILLGGDLRQYYMAKSLEKMDFAISYFGLQFPQDMPVARKCKGIDEVWDKLRFDNCILVLPVPVSPDGIYIKFSDLLAEKVTIEEVTEHLEKGHKIYGGCIPKKLSLAAQKLGCQVVDFMENEVIAIRNAASTAEGAIVEAKLLSDETIFGSKSLVLGFGKCAEILADRLKGLGSEVTIAARRVEIRAKAEMYGYRSIDFTPDEFVMEKPYKWQYVFNTVPEMVLDARFLNGLAQNVVIVDIASAPGGIDYEYAKKQGLTAKLCAGLPGKYAAKSAGEILAHVIK